MVLSAPSGSSSIYLFSKGLIQKRVRMAKRQRSGIDATNKRSCDSSPSMLITNSI